MAGLEEMLGRLGARLAASDPTPTGRITLTAYGPEGEQLASANAASRERASVLLAEKLAEHDHEWED